MLALSIHTGGLDLDLSGSYETGFVENDRNERQWPIPNVIGGTDATAIIKTAMYDRRPVKTWSKGCCTLLGDAAHPTLPFLAQGANMALEDAWALCACLLRAPDLNSALLHYETIRKPRVRKVIEAANNNAWPSPEPSYPTQKS